MLLLPIQGPFVNSTPRNFAQNPQQKQLAKSHSQPACDTVSFGMNGAKFANRLEEQCAALERLIKGLGISEFTDVKLKYVGDQSLLNTFISKGSYPPKDIAKLDDLLTERILSEKSHRFGNGGDCETEWIPCIKAAYERSLIYSDMDSLHPPYGIRKNLILNLDSPNFYEKGMTPFEFTRIGTVNNRISEDDFFPELFRYICAKIGESADKVLKVTTENGEEFLVSKASPLDGGNYNGLLINKIYN